MVSNSREHRHASTGAMVSVHNAAQGYDPGAVVTAALRARETAPGVTKGTDLFVVGNLINAAGRYAEEQGKFELAAQYVALAGEICTVDAVAFEGEDRETFERLGAALTNVAVSIRDTQTFPSTYSPEPDALVESWIDAFRNAGMNGTAVPYAALDVARSIERAEDLAQNPGLYGLPVSRGVPQSAALNVAFAALNLFGVTPQGIMSNEGAPPDTPVGGEAAFNRDGSRRYEAGAHALFADVQHGVGEPDRRTPVTHGYTIRAKTKAAADDATDWQVTVEERERASAYPSVADIQAQLYPLAPARAQEFERG